MRKTFVFGIVLLTSVLAQAQTKLLRQPTYSNGRIAFSYLGDIWIVNEDSFGLRRLTDHPAREVYPRFSPDGQWIAFSSNREGNYDVYIVSPNGGKPKQLTFHSAEDMVVGWTPDSKKIIFTSSRDKGVFPGVTTLMEISVDGGMEQPLPTDWGSWASYSADGSKMAFTRHPGVWSRRHYRGSYAVDLWLMDVSSKQFTKLADPDYKGNYLWPMYGRDGQIYFVADRLPDEKNIKFGGPEVMKSVNNIWRMPETGGTPVQVTHHTDGNLYFPSMSADGKTIVYEDDFGLWKLDVASGQSSEIRVEIRSDVKENEVEHRTIDSQAEDYSVSPSGRRVAVATHGEIFTVASDRGEPQRVTESYWREEEPRWSPNGKWIAFISDRSGREEIWMADERGHNVKQLSDVDCDKGSLVWSPDSRFLMYSGSDHKLRKVEIDGLKTEEVTSSEVGPIGSPEFSPDGKWVSYSKDDSILRSRVYVKKLDGGEEHMIGAKEFLIAYDAKWTPDGKKLLLLGGVGGPAMASLNRTVMQLYSVSLTHITKNPDDRDVDTEEQATSGGDTGGGGRGRGGRGGDAGSSRPEVKIEWDGLDRRIRQLTRLGGSVSSVVPSPDSRSYAVVAFGGDTGGGSTLYTISEDGSRLTPIVGGGGGFGDVQWSRDGRTIYYMQGSGVWAVGAPSGGPADSSPAAAAGGGFGRGRGRRGGLGGPAPTVTAAAPTSSPRRITFNVRLEVDSATERKQVFEEAWRVMRNRFYDPKMHGVDWDAAKARYEPLLDYMADVDELHNVIMEMIGEMNASHTGISGGGSADFISAPVQTRHAGFDLEPDDASGYYKVSYIYKHGPADHDYVKLNVGDYILAVNDKELKTSDNYWRTFNLYFGRKFEFTVNNKPESEGSWTVSIEPLSSGAQAELDYERWVDSRKAMVEKLSNGQFGYLHIRAMDAPSLQKFQRDLLDNIDKKALIIDERFNGGGGIDQELLAILNQRKKYESWRGRNSVEIPRPFTFFGPMVVMQNERSASDAEMFPEGFRTLGLGKLVGVPTYGAVIGTGAYRLMDGSQIRTPAYGVYTASGVDFENYGVQPDVLIDNTPADFLAGHDRQIEKAVETLKSQQQETQAGARSQ
jgi:tricorn protease